jgi:hypothetical protein
MLTGKTQGKFGLRMVGYPQLVRELRKLGAPNGRIVTAAIRGMEEDVEDLLGRAQREAPLDEGTLRASGTAAVFVDGKRVSGVAEQSGFVMLSAAGPIEGPKTHAMVHRDVDALAAQSPKKGGGVEGQVSFNTPYALEQHERLDFNHPKGGKAKYLEDPLKENADRYAGHIADRIGEALR